MKTAYNKWSSISKQANKKFFFQSQFSHFIANYLKTDHECKTMKLCVLGVCVCGENLQDQRAIKHHIKSIKHKIKNWWTNLRWNEQLSLYKSNNVITIRMRRMERWLSSLQSVQLLAHTWQHQPSATQFQGIQCLFWPLKAPVCMWYSDTYTYTWNNF